MRGIFPTLAKFSIILLALDSKVWAQVLPGAASPEIVGRTLSSMPNPTEQAGSAPILTTPQKGPETSDQAKKIRFVLKGLTVVGNKTIPTSELQKIWQNKLQKNISVADLFQMVQEITNYYRNKGYILTRAILPPQHVKGGTVKVQIIEGFIEKVTVSGTPHGARCQIWAFGNKVTQYRPTTMKSLEKYMLLANEIPATTVKSVLSPSKLTPGAADIELVSTNSPVTGYLSYDNYGTRYIGPQQMTGNLGLNSIFASGDSTQFTLTKTPRGGELTYGDVNYNVPLGAEGIRWITGATKTQTHPEFTLRSQNINGVNKNYYTNFVFPIIRARTQTLNARAGFNVQDSHTTHLAFNLITGVFEDDTLYRDHIRTLDLGGTYNWSDSLNGANLVSLDYRQGLPIWGYTKDTSPRTAVTSRPGGFAVYSKFVLTLSRLQAIKGPWSAYVLLTGQSSSVPLLTAEQFTFGGPQIGRGYDIAEIIGDQGGSGSLELRYDWAPKNTLYIRSLQFYAFYDAGVVYNEIDTPGLSRRESATSAGAGVRFWFNRYISGNVMWGQPLTRKVATEVQTEIIEVNHQQFFVGNGWRPRVFFSVVAAFD
jgi:hemolysin activation/secretion protein